MKFREILCFTLIIVNVECRYKEHRPCSFNPLCTCSNGGPDLGSVCCYNIPLMTIPSQINNSAVYIMSLNNNKLRFLEDNILNGTGIWKLQITNNLLTDISSSAFAGLEKTLSILDLSDNELARIPKEAIQILEKLYNLNLAGNHINYVRSDDLRGISQTLKILDLSNNAIIHLNNDVFRNMGSLETVNLAFNAISSIDEIMFQTPLGNLRELNLRGNQLHQIPLNALANLKNLKRVNLNENLISFISEGRETKNNIDIEELHVEFNLISELTPSSFRLFNEIDRLYLQGNPLTTINDTFLSTNVTELYMPNCKISIITKNAFFSVAQTLKILDLSNNELKEFPILPLYKLVKLSIGNNDINSITKEHIKSFENTLKYLDIRDLKLKIISEEILTNLPNLREFVLSKQTNSIMNIISNISPSMEKLSVTRGSVKTVANGAFQNLGGLKYLDFSHNKISKFGNNTFRDIGPSLETLKLHNCLKMSILPSTINHLYKLQYLDVSGNGIQHLTQDAFSMLHSLQYLNLNHNNIRELNTNFVSGIRNPNLMELKLAFNKIASLKFHSFRDLQKLIYLQLNDNLIRVISKSTFYNLDSLISIKLEGNSIENIESEAFQNLPNIQLINLSFNKLEIFNLEAFDQVGRLSDLKIEVDHNRIQNLTNNYTKSHTSSNVKKIDFSYNEIYFIENTYFDPIRLSVNNLDLSHNRLTNLTNMAFADMLHLQVLTLSNNFINVIEEDELKGLYNLQILDLSYNNIDELSENLFGGQNKLRVFSASHNDLEFIPEEIFSATDLEQLDLSFNNLKEFPEDSIYEIKETIQFIDISGNQIKYMNFSNTRHLQNLRHLSISNIGLHLPSLSSQEIYLPKLIYLDLSHNPIKEMPEWILDFFPRSLELLNLANTSMDSIPSFDGCNILYLNLSLNSIQNIPSKALEQVKNVQILDMSSNQLSSISNTAWSSLQQLRSLYLHNNPIQSISNSSFNNLEQIQELYMKDLKVLEDIHKDAFNDLTALKKIEIDTYFKSKNINLAQLLSKSQVLKEIYLNVKEHELEKLNNIPKSLRAIILEGKSLRHISEHAFADIKNKDITLNIRHTNITVLPKKLFQSLEVENFTAILKNNKLQRIERIISPEKQHIKILKGLELSGNELHCNCELHWIWEWLSEYEYQNGCNEINCDEEILHDLRETHCLNMNKSIISAFKEDLDCFTSNSNILKNMSIILIIVTILFHLTEFA